MYNNDILFQCVNDKDFQYKIVENLVFDLICSESGISLQDIFAKNTTKQTRSFRKMYIDIMVNYFGYNQTDVARIRFDSRDSFVHAILNTLHIFNDDYEKAFKSITQQIDQIKNRNHLVENPNQTSPEDSGQTDCSSGGEDSL